MLRSFEKKMIAHDLFKKGDRIVIAVSGGVDSMVLMDLLCRLLPTWHFDLTIAHVNHGLRGKKSDADEKLVREVVTKRKLRIKVAKWKKPRRINLQDAARNFRYDFFEQVTKEVNASHIVTAHNLDDQAETVLMHLIRGTGVKGLSGMSPVSGIAPRIIRPLLFFTRNEIYNYAKRRRVPFAEDETNQKTIYKRNFIRHNVIPILERLNPRVKESLAEASFCLREYDIAVDALANEYAYEYFKQEKEGIYWARTPFLVLPNAIRHRIFSLAYESIRGDRKNLNSDQIQHMDEICTGKKGSGRYMLPANFEFVCYKDTVSINRCV